MSNTEVKEDNSHLWAMAIIYMIFSTLFSVAGWSQSNFSSELIKDMYSKCDVNGGVKTFSYDPNIFASEVSVICNNNAFFYGTIAISNSPNGKQLVKP